MAPRAKTLMEPAPSQHLDPTVLIGVAVILAAAKIGGEIFERLKQPGVLGELCAGVVIGNLVLFGFTGAEPLKTNETIAALAELGVIILLFEVGLESDRSRTKSSIVSLDTVMSPNTSS